MNADDLIIHKNTHEGIISREVFNAVQEQLKIRTKNITAPKKHLFTNILYCADCGTGMWYRHNRAGYICGLYARHGSKACSGHTIKEDFLIKTILSDIKSWVEQIDKEVFVKELEKRSQKSMTQLQKQLDKITKDIDTLKKRKRNYINLLADRKISHEEYQEIVEANNID